jgi:hypothetical protein
VIECSVEQTGLWLDRCYVMVIMGMISHPTHFGCLCDHFKATNVDGTARYSVYQ